MSDTPKWYDVHLPEFQKVAYIKSMKEYTDLYQRSIEDPDSFWSEQAKRYLEWEKDWDFVLRYDVDALDNNLVLLWQDAKHLPLSAGILTANDSHLIALGDMHSLRSLSLAPVTGRLPIHQ